MKRVYKSASNYIIELDINLDTTLTNLNREVIDENYAKYRCNKAIVVKIYNKFDEKEEIDRIRSDHDDRFEYIKGKDVYEPKYNLIMDEVCTTGIHFYITKEAAFYYNLSSINDGIFKKWFADGKPLKKCSYKDDKLEGLYETWYKNGNRQTKCSYKDDKLEGLYENWYEYGNRQSKCNYKDHKLEGLYEAWYANGNRQSKCSYKDDKLEGLYEEWYENGDRNFTYS
jgi:antitoxin component YwqK of YwqJK toxin-antitoxin module